jgi:hypothetical protein
VLKPIFLNAQTGIGSKCFQSNGGFNAILTTNMVDERKRRVGRSLNSLTAGKIPPHDGF